MTSSEGFQQHFSIISKFVCCIFYMKRNVAFTLISFAVLKWDGCLSVQLPIELPVQIPVQLLLEFRWNNLLSVSPQLLRLSSGFTQALITPQALLRHLKTETVSQKLFYFITPLIIRRRNSAIQTFLELIRWWMCANTQVASIFFGEDVPTMSHCFLFFVSNYYDILQLLYTRHRLR